MIEIVEQKIKKLYESKASFCESQCHKYKDFASKLRTFDAKINWLNEFLKPLNLEVVTHERGQNKCEPLNENTKQGDDVS